MLNYVNNLKDQNKDVPDLGTVDGVYVAKVEDNSAASAAGIEKGDVIVGVDGKNITKMAETCKRSSTASIRATRLQSLGFTTRRR